MTRHLFWMLVAAIASSCGIAAQTLVSAAVATQLQVSFVHAGIVKDRLNLYKGDDTTREATLRQIFMEAGCSAKDLSEQAVPHRKQPNVICVLPGNSEETIVVGAHFDHVAIGDGVIDNWSGASILPSLFQSLAKQPRHHTFVFVGFTGEEEGLLGSDFYVQHLKPTEIHSIDFMVNLDTLGLGPTLVWESKSDPLMVGGLLSMSQSLDLPLAPVNLNNFGESDEESFIREHICTLTVHSLTPENAHVLHRKEDTMDAMHFSDYYATYRLLAAYLSKLDGDAIPAGHVCKIKANPRSGMRGILDPWRKLAGR